MKFNFEEISDQISALIPFYDENGGNASKIYTKDGEVVSDKRTMRWVIKKIAKSYAVDLEALRQKYAKNLSVKQGVPLPFSPQLILVPLKLRSVMVDSDGAGGYVNLLSVQGVEDYSDEKNNNFKSLIYLEGEQTVPCIFSRKTVDSRLEMGKLTRERYLYYTGGGGPSPMVKDGQGKSEIPPDILAALGKLIWGVYYYGKED